MTVMYATSNEYYNKTKQGKAMQSSKNIVLIRLIKFKE